MPEGARDSGQECKMLSVIFLVPYVTSSYSPPIRIVSSGEGQGKHGLTLGIREDPEYWVHWLSFHIFIAEKV